MGASPSKPACPPGPASSRRPVTGLGKAARRQGRQGHWQGGRNPAPGRGPSSRPAHDASRATARLGLSASVRARGPRPPAAPSRAGGIRVLDSDLEDTAASRKSPAPPRHQSLFSGFFWITWIGSSVFPSPRPLMSLVQVNQILGICSTTSLDYIPRRTLNISPTPYPAVRRRVRRRGCRAAGPRPRPSSPLLASPRLRLSFSRRLIERRLSRAPRRRRAQRSPLCASAAVFMVPREHLQLRRRQ